MEHCREGLNFVPLLAQNTSPPCSSRSRISLNQKRSQRSIICYNGNYEGDSSMFKDKLFELERLSLVDTESDNEFPKVPTQRSTFSAKATAGRSCSLAWRLLEFLMQQFLKPEMREKVSNKLENFMESSFYNRLAKWWAVVTLLFTYILYISLIFCKCLTWLCHILWKRRVVFRNLARRLLWWLTLAKCADLSLFALILCSLPLLFILAFFGFIISICSGLKDALHRWGYLMNNI